MRALNERIAARRMEDEAVAAPRDLVEHPRRLEISDLTLLAVLRAPDCPVTLPRTTNPDRLLADVLPTQGVKLAGTNAGPGRELDHRAELGSIPAEHSAGLQKLAVLVE